MRTLSLSLFGVVLVLAIIAGVIGAHGDSAASPRMIHTASMSFVQSPKETDFFAKCLKNSESSAQAYTISDVEGCKQETITYSLKLHQARAIGEPSSSSSRHRN